MEDLNLPRRLIAAGERTIGQKVNTYQKMSIIQEVKDSLNASENDIILHSPLGRLFDIPNKPACSGTFGLFLLSSQLEITKKHEIWILFAGTPIRFSLREFKIVTGLACGRYPATKTNKQPRTTSQEKPRLFYGELFGVEKNVTLGGVISLLRTTGEEERDKRLRLACLALVDGILLPTTHYHKAKIDIEHVEMVEDLDKFLQYPWGRLSYDRMMDSIKRRDLAQLATSDVAVQGLFIALQFVFFEAVPAILEDFVPAQLKLNHVRELERQLEESSDVDVQSIIRPEFVFDSEEEDLSWSDEDEVEQVDNMVSLIRKGFKFKKEMFSGGRKPAELVGLPTPTTKRGSKGQNGRGKKGKSTIRQPVPRRKNQGEYSSVNPTQTLIDNSTMEAFKVFEKKVEDIVAEKLHDKLHENNKFVIEGITKWLSENITSSRAEYAEDIVARKLHENSKFVLEGITKWLSENNRYPRAGEPANVVTSPPCCCDTRAKPRDTNVGSRTQINVSDVVTSPPAAVTHEQNPFDNSDVFMGDTNVGSDFVNARTQINVSDRPLKAYTRRKKSSQNIGEEVARCLKLSQNIDNDEVAISADVAATQDDMMDAHDEDDASLVIWTRVEQTVNPCPVVLHTNDTDAPALHNPKGIDVDVACIPAEKPRRSKRIASSQLNRCGKRTTTNKQTRLEKRFEAAMKSLTRSSLTVGSMETSISAKEINDLLERSETPTAKVVDALCKLTRKILRAHESDGTEKLRVEVLDSTFVAQLCGDFTKLRNSPNREDFTISPTVVDMVLGEGNTDRLKLFEEADTLYLPFNFDKIHWVALAVNLYFSKIIVLDCVFSARPDDVIKQNLEPLAVMLPFMFNKIAGNDLYLSGVPLSPFSIERVSGLPQISNPVDSGVMSMLFMQAHGAAGGVGGVEKCRMVDPEQLPNELKKLVTYLIENSSPLNLM